VGGLLGIGVGYAMLRSLIAVMPKNTLPIEADLRLNLPILFFTFLATALAGLLFGCVPAWYSSRVDPAKLSKKAAAREQALAVIACAALWLSASLPSLLLSSPAQVWPFTAS